MNLLLAALMLASAQPAQPIAQRHLIEPGQRSFAVAVPEGNHRVTLTFGGGARASRTSVKAEGRRLMLEDVQTRPRRSVERSFIVNVRTPAIPPPPDKAPGGSAVQLTPGERAGPNWDDQLSLEFLGSAAAVRSVEIAPVEVPTVYLVGDSTVTDQLGEPAASWGQMLTRFLGPGVAVANHAHSGETMKSFITGYRLAKVLSTLKRGDWLLIQFGHNDQKAQWPQTFADAATTYPAYLRVFIAEARLRGATPILISSPERRNFGPTGRIEPSLGAYPEAVRLVAREEGVGLIDLTSMTVAFYEALGPDRAPLAFNDGGRDKTHHNNYGAYEIARMVAAGISAADRRLAGHLLPVARSYDPARPTPPESFVLPSSSIGSHLRPKGS
jgi:lysophospholipase L1-like esterase